MCGIYNLYCFHFNIRQYGVLFYKTNALHTEKQVMLQEHQKEKTIAFIILNNKNDIEHDLKQENQNLEVAYKNILILEKEKYETEVAEIQESINELNNYIGVQPRYV